MRDPLVAEVEHWLDRLYVAADGATLRQEERRKAVQVAAMLREIEMAASRLSNRDPLLLVDAAAGKSYVGLLAAGLVLEPMRRAARVVTIETDPARVQASRRALETLATSVPIECRAGDVRDPHSWPEQPSIVAALHACGAASDAIIERGTHAGAKVLLIVPCCTGKKVPVIDRAIEAAQRLHIPHQAPVRRRFIQAWVDAERTRALESAGYHTEVVEFVAATVTPHNLLWRARRTGMVSSQHEQQSSGTGGCP